MADRIKDMQKREKDEAQEFIDKIYTEHQNKYDPASRAEFHQNLNRFCKLTTEQQDRILLLHEAFQNEESLIVVLKKRAAQKIMAMRQLVENNSSIDDIASFIVTKHKFQLPKDEI